MYDSDNGTDSESEDMATSKEGLYSKEKGRISSLSKLRSLFHLLKVSEQWKNKLKICCEVCSNTFLAPNIDVCTRWNSTFEMLRKALQMKDALDMLCRNNANLKHLTIDDCQWSILEEAAKFLQYFKILSDLLSGDRYVTLSTVVIGFNMLIDKLEDTKIDLSLNDERTPIEDNILEALQIAIEKLLKHYYKSHWTYCACLILDPRHKVETFEKTTWGTEMASQSQKKFEEIFKNKYFKPTVKIFQYNLNLLILTI